MKTRTTVANPQQSHTRTQTDLAKNQQLLLASMKSEAAGMLSPGRLPQPASEFLSGETVLAYI